MKKTVKTQEQSSQTVDTLSGFSSQAVKRIILLLITIRAGFQQWSDKLQDCGENHIDFIPKHAFQTNIQTSKKLFADFHVYQRLIILTWESRKDATSRGSWNRQPSKRERSTNPTQHAVFHETSTCYETHRDTGQEPGFIETHTNAIACQCSSTDNKLWGEKQPSVCDNSSFTVSTNNLQALLPITRMTVYICHIHRETKSSQNMECKNKSTAELK